MSHNLWYNYRGQVNTLKGNTGSGSPIGFNFFDASGNTLTGNIANGNVEVGFALELFSSGNTLEGNTATGNGLFDLFHDFTSTPNTWVGNTCGTKSGADIPPC